MRAEHPTSTSSGWVACLRICAAVSSVALAACSHDRVSAPVPVEEFREADAAALLSVPQELQALPAQWGHHLMYMVVTPYPSGTTKYENPSLYAGIDGVGWGAAPGAPMPLAKPTAGYLSDPDLSYNPETNDLMLYYRQASKVDDIFMIRSHDGAVWSSPTKVVSGAFSSVLSPAIVRRGVGDWAMWSVNGAPGGCHGASTTVQMRRSIDGLVWSEAQNVDLPLSKGLYAWHIDVQWIPERNEYWALFPVKTAGTCATKAVYLATSPDGVKWQTVSAPVVTAGAISEFRDVVYRSTFAYDAANDQVTFWFSGARSRGKKKIAWRTAVQRRWRSDIFTAIAAVAKPTVPDPTDDLQACFDPP